MELIKNLMNAIHYVDSHLTQDISVEDVASQAYMSVSHLSAVGRNPGAKSDIRSTMLLGQAVAETTGLYGLLVAMLLMFVKPFV